MATGAAAANSDGAATFRSTGNMTGSTVAGIVGKSGTATGAAAANCNGAATFRSTGNMTGMTVVGGAGSATSRLARTGVADPARIDDAETAIGLTSARTESGTTVGGEMGS